METDNQDWTIELVCNYLLTLNASWQAEANNPEVAGRPCLCQRVPELHEIKPIIGRMSQAGYAALLEWYATDLFSMIGPPSEDNICCKWWEIVLKEVDFILAGLKDPPDRENAAKRIAQIIKENGKPMRSKPVFEVMNQKHGYKDEANIRRVMSKEAEATQGLLCRVKKGLYDVKSHSG